MKDYLKEELSQEERLIIIGIIWKVSRKFKMLYYEEKKKYHKRCRKVKWQIDKHGLHIFHRDFSKIHIKADKQAQKGRQADRTDIHSH